MISGRSCQKNKVRSCETDDETDDGGSAYAASSADALSSDISSFQSDREEPPAAHVVRAAACEREYAYIL